MLNSQAQPWFAGRMGHKKNWWKEWRLAPRGRNIMPFSSCQFHIWLMCKFLRIAIGVSYIGFLLLWCQTLSEFQGSHLTQPKANLYFFCVCFFKILVGTVCVHIGAFIHLEPMYSNSDDTPVFARIPPWGLQQSCVCIHVPQSARTGIDISIHKPTERSSRWGLWAQVRPCERLEKLIAMVQVRQMQAKQSANLIAGQDGHAIYNHLDAIADWNDLWGCVCSVNALRDDPMNILACVTPLIYHPFVVKTVFSKCHCESHLQHQEWRVGAPSNASCGLIIFSYYTMFRLCFLNEIENCSRNLPSCLVAAKQVLLDKPFAKDTPGTTLQAIATVATSYPSMANIWWNKRS